MVKGHSAREETGCWHHMGYSFRLAGRDFCYMYHPTDRIAHTTWSIGRNEKQLNASSIKDRSDEPLHHERRLYHGATSHFLCKSIIYNIVSAMNLTTCVFVYVCIKREVFYLTTHSTHFIYGYMASDIWLRTILIVRKETRCRHIGYSYRLTARVLLYAPSHR